MPASTAPDAGDEEDDRLFDLAERLQGEVAEPWFMEMNKLRRVHFPHLNKRLVEWKKKVQDDRKVCEADAATIGVLLHEQADAIRDFQLIRSLHSLTPEEMEKRRLACTQAFPSAFWTDSYRCIPYADKTLDNERAVDEVRELIRRRGPKALTWSSAKKYLRKAQYDRGYAPSKLSSSMDRLARFLVAMMSALFILVPVYIMSLNQSQTKNLITTTVAMVLFTMICFIMLRTTADQTLGFTAAYAAVLVVFVGLTSQTPVVQ